MKLLNCVFSYNRYHYLRNTVESLLEFFQLGDTLVIDDGSDNPELLDYLSGLVPRGVEVIRRPRWPSDTHLRIPLGGLYENMDVAVEFARSHNYDYVYFIQDDVQFMWHDPDVLSNVEHVFHTMPDASQVAPIFLKQILFTKEYKLHFQIYPQGKCYHRFGAGMSAMGIIPVRLITDIRFHFGNGTEKTNSGWWHRRGYKSYGVTPPTMAWVPQPAINRYSERVVEGRVPVEKYYLKPLEDWQINKLSESPLEDFPFLEDYCFPWGWHCPTPYQLSLGEGRTKLVNPARRLAQQLLPKRLKRPLSKALRALSSDE